MTKEKNAKKPIKKATKPAQTKTAKATSQKKAFKRADAKSPKKSGGDKTKDSVQEFPFWGRLKIDKNRTTLVIDDEMIIDKITKKMEEGFVHREATHTKKKEYEEIKPNPDRDDPEPMYLKRPRKLPKRLIKPHEKNLDMPEHLKKRYEKNNKKNK